MNWSYFYASDAPFIKPYSAAHIWYLLFCFAVIFLVLFYKEKLQKNADTLGKVLLWVILFQQMWLYGGFLVFGQFTLKESLPMHICRWASILAVFYFITKKQFFLDVVCYLSPYALSSFFYPKNVYHLLHFQGISYMINHLVTVLIPIIAIAVFRWLPSWKAFLNASCTYLVFLALANLANKLTGGNYYYLTDRPFLKALPLWFYCLLATCLTIGCFAIFSFVGEAVSKRQKKTVCESVTAI